LGAPAAKSPCALLFSFPKLILGWHKAIFLSALPFPLPTHGRASGGADRWRKCCGLVLSAREWGFPSKKRIFSSFPIFPPHRLHSCHFALHHVPLPPGHVAEEVQWAAASANHCDKDERAKAKKEAAAVASMASYLDEHVSSPNNTAWRGQGTSIRRHPTHRPLPGTSMRTADLPPRRGSRHHPSTLTTIRAAASTPAPSPTGPPVHQRRTQPTTGNPLYCNALNHGNKCPIVAIGTCCITKTFVGHRCD
jgi:hypothetical protein